MSEIQPHIFHSIGETSGAFGLQALMCEVFASKISADLTVPVGYAESVKEEILKRPGVLSFISYLPAPLRSDASLTRVLFHERFHYWHLISTPAMIAGHFAHLRLIEERVLSAGGHSRKFLCLHPIFHFESLREAAKSNRSLMMRTMAMMMLQDRPVEEYKARCFLQNREWLHLLMYLKWVVNHTTVEFTESPRDYFIRLPLDESTFVAMSKVTTLLDVIIRYIPARRQYVVVPMSATALLESAAYVAECLFLDQLPSFPNEPEMGVDWYIYREPWMTWYRLYGDLFRDKTVAAHAFIATVDLALCTDWLGQARYFGDADLRDGMLSPSYRFTTLLRAHKRVRSQLEDHLDPKKISWSHYQEKICTIMGWPKPKTVVRRLLEFTCILDAIIYGFFDKIENDFVKRYFRPEREENTDEELQKLFDKILRIREATGGSTPVLGQGLLEVMLCSLISRYQSPEIWADPVTNYKHLLEVHDFGLPVFWINDRPFAEGGAPVVDIMRYISLHGFSALTGIEDHALQYLLQDYQQNGDRAMRLDFDNERNPMRCGIEEQDVDCDHVSFGFVCPFRAKKDEPNLASRCYYVDTLDQLGLGTHSLIPEKLRQRQAKKDISPQLEQFLSALQQGERARGLEGPEMSRKGPETHKKADRPKTGHIIQVPGGFVLADSEQAELIHETQDYSRQVAKDTRIHCPHCGELMRPSISGLTLQCGERSRQRHPVVQWSPLDGKFQTPSAEIAESLAAKGWTVEGALNFYEMKPPSNG